jgi:hypothetical protein
VRSPSPDVDIDSAARRARHFVTDGWAESGVSNGEKPAAEASARPWSSCANVVRVTTIPAEYHDLLNAPNTAVLTALQSDGSPNSSPVWFWFDGDALFVSTVTDRSKHRNVRRDPRVSLTVVDPVRPLRYIEIRGSVTIEDDPGAGLRDRIAMKHGFPDGSKFDPPGATRVALRLHPTRVIEH